ncbi:hypothetical protein P8C59_003709 [Phyllachora maydis]|uniref:SET domain-containing protein n=1 Tax=Phyllachora maydis TaxID=1825666 RepID=A0AAD9I2A3_9PEZI|nr:hypothetical protein P8C59_003709 [Phyllachora maydis]
MAASDFGQHTARFLDWFKKLPGATFHDAVRIVDLRERGAGRGIVATADIPPDTVLFTIPRAAILSSATAPLFARRPPSTLNLDAALGDLDLDLDLDRHDAWTALILALLHEHLRGADSPWKPYLDVLPPPGAFDTPLHWTLAELAHLQASPVVGRVGREDADALIRRQIVPVVRQHADLFAGSGALGDEELVRLAHRVGSTIMAYAFDLDAEEDAEDEEDEEGWVEDREGRSSLGMVPMADILNADAEFNAHINHGQEALTATALRRIARGEEVLNYYGPLGNGELLRRYGYVTEKHARHDVVELPWALVATEMRKLLGLDEHDWQQVAAHMDPDAFEDGFVLDRDGDEPDATGALRGEAAFQALPEGLWAQFTDLLKAVKKVRPAAVEALPGKKEREAAYFDTVAGALRACEAQYPTSLEEDQELLAGGDVDRRQRMAIWVRLGEKKLLREAQRWVQSQLAGLHAAGEPDGEPSAKRQRRR